MIGLTMPTTNSPPVATMPASDDPAVFILSRASRCSECGKELDPGAWITLTGEGDSRQAVCLACSDFDHLVFLPRGDAALTRRAGKHSKLRCIVLKWSRSRKRHERQGVLVEEHALHRAEEECLADAELRERRADRRREQDAKSDVDFANRFANAILESFPGAPAETATAIARHACQRHSGRVGRSAAAREHDPETVRLAVRAHLRHAQTRYDELLMQGIPRHDARREILHQLNAAEARWRNSEGETPTAKATPP